MFVHLTERIYCKVFFLLILIEILIVSTIVVVINNWWGGKIYMLIVFISMSFLTIAKTIVVTIVILLEVSVIILLRCIGSYIWLSHVLLKGRFNILLVSVVSTIVIPKIVIKRLSSFLLIDVKWLFFLIAFSGLYIFLIEYWWILAVYCWHYHFVLGHSCLWF